MSQKRKLEEKDETLPDKSIIDAESEQADKKKRLDEETSGFSVDAVQCRICLDVAFCLTMRSLPCAHAFHENCLFQWLEISDVCPLCKWPTRKEIRNSYLFERYESYSGESSDDSYSDEANDEFPWAWSNRPSRPSGSAQAGSSGESSQAGSNGGSSQVGSNAGSQSSGSNGGSSQVGSNAGSQSSGSNGGSPVIDFNGGFPATDSNGGSLAIGSNDHPHRLNVLELYDFYVWSDDPGDDNSNEDEDT